MVGMSKPVLLRPGRLQSSCTICIMTLRKEKIQSNQGLAVGKTQHQENVEAKHKPLPIGFKAGLIRFRQIKTQPLRMLRVDGLNDVQRPLAQSLADRVEKHENQVRQFACNRGPQWLESIATCLDLKHTFCHPLQLLRLLDSGKKTMSNGNHFFHD